MTIVQTLRVDGADGLVGSEVPYIELGSSDLGPTVCLMAGVHGCEYSSMLGLRRFLAHVDESQLQGRILAVPIANLASFESRTPFVVPHDGLNLNRCFPGDPAGSFTERLAHQLFDTVIRPSDYLVDLHAGDQVEALEPFTLFDASDVEERSRAIAHAYGLPYSIRAERSASPVAGTSSAAAAEVTIPAITAEAGGRGLVDEISVELHLNGIRGVLASLGILPASLPAPLPPIELSRWVWLRSPSSGWWSPTVAAGDRVSADEIVGTVSSLLGREVVEIRAPESGVPLFVTTSPAVAADGLLLGLGIG
ncbi:MAG: putative succinylglutamate desuccinylase / aspartoacylase family [Acidimicrobiaceae bacterium]|jgi:predicted deacylase|nr:putative succinylglutamate desuccinylase / aspartoacylase family [Acidimicrobiaceae bacterium]